MKSNIAVMADEDTVTGFRLGGITEGYPVKNMKRYKKFSNLIKRDFSVIITTEKIGIEFRDTINRLTNERALPMVIEVPDKSGSIKRESDPMSELIRS